MLFANLNITFRERSLFGGSAHVDTFPGVDTCQHIKGCRRPNKVQMTGLRSTESISTCRHMSALKCDLLILIVQYIPWNIPTFLFISYFSLHPCDNSVRIILVYWFNGTSTIARLYHLQQSDPKGKGNWYQTKPSQNWATCAYFVVCTLIFPV